MRRLLAWIATIAIGGLVLALSAFFAVTQSQKKPQSPMDATGGFARPVPHSIENRKACNQCHLPGSAAPYPADHIGFPEGGCTVCHRAP